jgi:hypothetical protein
MSTGAPPASVTPARAAARYSAKPLMTELTNTRAGMRLFIDAAMCTPALLAERRTHRPALAASFFGFFGGV